MGNDYFMLHSADTLQTFQKRKLLPIEEIETSLDARSRLYGAI